LISTIFFDLHGTLINGAALHPCYSAALGQILSQRFGGAPDAWAAANGRVLADWDSYYADLDLNGERGIDHMWEGLYRTTRAMFRLMDTPEPPRTALRALSRELPGLVTRECDALYADARPVIERLCAAGYMLGVTSHALEEQSRGLLRGGNVLRYFAAPVIGPDTVGHFSKDEAFYTFAARLADVDPAECLTVDDSLQSVDGARAAGFHALYIARRPNALTTRRHRTLRDLNGLLDYLGLTLEEPR
jgi:FMN phosphatase YigB (HAD superfamily)